MIKFINGVLSKKKTVLPLGSKCAVRKSRNANKNVRNSYQWRELCEMFLFKMYVHILQIFHQQVNEKKVSVYIVQVQI